jgi:hypothetical protein
MTMAMYSSFYIQVYDILEIIVMNILVDISGRIEQTNKCSVLAYSNGHSKSIYISSKSKKKLQELFKKANKPRMFVIKTYVALLFLLLFEDLESIISVTIDQEYEGHEVLVKGLLIELIRKNGKYFEKGKIQYSLVGKSSNCHMIAISTFRGDRKPDIIVSYEDIVKLML